MNEWYVFSEGDKPLEVCLGRRVAVDRLLEGDFPVTPSEKKQISLFMEAVVCDLGAGLHLVGTVREYGDTELAPAEPRKDRRLTRVVGPGALV